MQSINYLDTIVLQTLKFIQIKISDIKWDFIQLFCVIYNPN